MIIVVLNLVKQGYNLTDTDQYPLKHNIAPLNMDVSLSIFLAYATSLNIGLLDSILGKYSLGFLLHDTKSTWSRSCHDVVVRCSTTTLHREMTQFYQQTTIKKTSKNSSWEWIVHDFKKMKDIKNHEK